MLADLKPTAKNKIFDLAQTAGFDVSDWVASARDPRKFKANPKYCYEWAFIEPGKLIILNLWHAEMNEEAGRIVLRANFRSDADFHRTVSKKTQWATRATRLDDAIKTALSDNLPVRVIILDGERREREDFDSDPSKVKFRELDPEPWTITGYDWATGDFELTRGILTSTYVDQFDLDQADKSGPEKRDQSGSVYVRDPKVRQKVRFRAAGICELCGQAGFHMASGAIYLETHHIIPLADGGDDHETNVAALCAHDHRRAHYAADRDDIAASLQDIVQAKYPRLP